MGIFNMEDRTLDGIDAALLTTQTENAMLGLVENLLTDNGIVYILRDREAGDYMRVLGGFSIFGTDVYVKRDDYERAKGLLDAYVNGGGESAE